MATPRFGSYQLTVYEVYTTSVLNFLILDTESLTPVLSDLEKQPYVARAVHFSDEDSSLLISYLESGFV